MEARPGRALAPPSGWSVSILLGMFDACGGPQSAVTITASLSKHRYFRVGIPSQASVKRRIT